MLVRPSSEPSCIVVDVLFRSVLQMSNQLPNILKIRKFLQVFAVLKLHRSCRQVHLPLCSFPYLQFRIFYSRIA